MKTNSENICNELGAGLIGMTEPDKPTSKNQKYFKI